MSIEDLNKNFNERWDKLDVKIDALLKASTAIEKRVESSEVDIINLQQRERGHNLRIVGFKVPLSSEVSATSMADAVYNTVVEPILKIAFEEGMIPRIPDMIECFDACHPLPAKKEENPPIHLRLKSKIIREVILTRKGKFFKSSDVRCSIFEDLAPKIQVLLRKTKARADVTKTWTRNDRIKYMVRDKQEVFTAKL